MKNLTLFYCLLLSYVPSFCYRLPQVQVLVYELMSPCPLQAEMSSWLRVVNAAIATASSASGEPEEPVVPSASRGLTRAMTMPPVSQPEGSIVLRSKDGREREREKRFSFFKKNK